MKHIIATVINDLTTDHRMQKTCTTLANAGFQVTLVGRELPNSAPLQERPYRQVRLKCRYQSGKRFYIEYNFRLKKYLHTQQYDILLAVDLDTIIPCILAAQKPERPVVYDAHEYFPEVPELQHRPLTKKVWQQVERWAMPRTATRYTVSHAIAEEFLQIYGLPFEVVMNVPRLSETPALQEPEQVVLYQGALNQGRGLEALLEAAPTINAEIWILGEGDLSQELRRRANALGVQNQVRFLGQVPSEETWKFTAKAKVGYNVLEPLGKSYYFSLSNKFFAYMHMGVPCISSAFPEYLRINQEAPVTLFSNAEASDVAATINHLLQDRSLWQEMHQNALQLRNKYCWEREEDKLKAIFNGL